ncbi:MerR family transcriptional regulator [Nocardioides sp. zg-ZUI104]|uniref:heat shock protein transcriptional repressor HspR n=1 Tax=Nocardioides faecalis TaxID=2803858 RepID=UPI001BCF19A0|nr:MerR family transcriptional regulator [Nocardioides faecalis]MBS4752854.1 MerR family transcriptional regulator [Nocardioides faecalis]
MAAGTRAGGRDGRSGGRGDQVPAAGAHTARARPASGAGVPGPPGENEAVFVISVAAQLSGLHPQTLRTYERVGLITPGRTGGGGRRYSYRDIERLRMIADLTAAGIGIEGVRRILDLENAVEALRDRNAELVAELEATREALREAVRSPAAPQPPRSNLPALRATTAGQAVVVWRRRP